jgi:predicted nuclease of predicted toxin-antitoxin system
LIKIKLDESISRHLKQHLQQEGYDVFTAVEEGLLGKSDVEVGAAAKSEKLILFTLDLEFADLRKFPPGTHPGIILFRPHSMGPLATNRFIVNFVKETDMTALSGCTVIVDPIRVRIRRPPLDTDTTEWEKIPE